MCSKFHNKDAEATISLDQDYRGLLPQKALLWRWPLPQGTDSWGPGKSPQPGTVGFSAINLPAGLLPWGHRKRHGQSLNVQAHGHTQRVRQSRAREEKVVGHGPGPLSLHLLTQTQNSESKNSKSKPGRPGHHDGLYAKAEEENMFLTVC